MITLPANGKVESEVQGCNMSIVKEKRISRTTVFEGHLIKVYTDEADLAGRRVHREVVLHQEASAIIPIDKDGNVLFVEQYRYPVDKVLLEIPAGKVDPGEDGLTCARRELEEETGYTGELIHLGDVYTTPGFCNELIHLYLAENLVHTHQHLDEGEFLNVVAIPLKKVFEDIRKGHIHDAKTLSAFAIAGKRLKRFADK